jgi:hypothetical protein
LHRIAAKKVKPFGSAGFRSFLLRQPPAIKGGLGALDPLAIGAKKP